MGGNAAGTPEVFTRARSFLANLLGLPRFSSLYRTDPQLDTEQEPFWNAAAAGDWPGGPESLLERLLMWESGAGRQRDPLRPKGPRVIDLDLLFAEGAVRATARLTLPHPGLFLRRFALEPLLEVLPDAVDSADRPMREKLEPLQDQGVDRTGRTW